MTLDLSRVEPSPLPPGEDPDGAADSSPLAGGLAAPAGLWTDTLWADGGAAELLGQAGGTQVLSRPGAGQEIAIPAQRGSAYVLGFDPGAARVSTEGNDLVLSFGSDGGRLVFRDFADALSSGGAPSFQIGDQTLAGRSLYSQAQALGPSDLALVTAGGPGPGGLGSGSGGYDDDLGDLVELQGGQGGIGYVVGESSTLDIPETDNVSEETILLELELAEEEPPEEETPPDETAPDETLPGGDDSQTSLSSDDVLSQSLAAAGGDETLSGGPGRDVFAFDGSDAGQTTTITNFTLAEEDLLDLRAFVTDVPEESGDGLDDHLDFAFGGGDSTISVDSNGALAGGEATVIVLQGLDLSGLGSTEAQTIQALLDGNNLDAV